MVSLIVVLVVVIVIIKIEKMVFFNWWLLKKLENVIKLRLIVFNISLRYIRVLIIFWFVINLYRLIENK